MSWRHYLCDARTGHVVRPLDIPSFNASVTISSFGFQTTSRDTGDTSERSLTVPYTVFDEHDGTGTVTRRATPSQIASLLSSGRRALASCWTYDGCPDRRGIPVMMGVIGDREDGMLDTTFPLSSTMTLLGSRYLIRDGMFTDGRSRDVISMQDLSYRGLAASLGVIGTDAKNGGGMAVDWQYAGERGSHQRTRYAAWNVQNLSVAKLLTDMSNMHDGIDMTFRPRWSGADAFRNVFTAPTDGDRYLDAALPAHVLTVRPDGGSLQGFKISYASAVQRLYATGAGTDESTVTAIAEDMSQIAGSSDPPLLMESTYSDTNVTDSAQLKSKAMGVLGGVSRPRMQFTGSIGLDDAGPNGLPLNTLGSFWPGDAFDVMVTGHRTLPDGVYHTRLMQMDLSQEHTAALKFDVMDAPF